jgi:hypothetical protein
MALENDPDVVRRQSENYASWGRWTFSLRETFICLTAFCAIAGWYVERSARLRFEDVARSILEDVEKAKVDPKYETASIGWIDGITVSCQVNEGAAFPVPDATAKSDREESVVK